MSSKQVLFLVGFPGTGKTGAGVLAAQILGWKFVDTDTLVEKHAGKPVHRIFAEDGESAFRSLESQAIQQASSGQQVVVSVGGGAFIDPQSRALMLEKGLVVCLEASPETIYQRLQAQEDDSTVRPLLQGSNPLERIRTLKASRQPYYDMADHTLSTEGISVAETASRLVQIYQQDSLSPGGGPMEEPNLAATVHHSSGSYPVLVGRGLLADFGKALSELSLARVAYIISDEHVFREYGRNIQQSLEASGIPAHCYLIPPGEGSKSHKMAEDIYAWLAEIKAERGHTIVALGGGVVGDLAGFVAATFLRGMRFVQVPTSMAAMVDASIGGKVAVNLPQGKNLVGAFYQPSLVLADVDTLATLGQRELSEGWAEAIKHGLILDASLFDTFEEHAEALMGLKGDIATQVIRRSVAIKAQVVSEDERETLGRRILLNYGHTIGHGLEAATSYGQYLHGEAVSVGMMGAARIGCELGITPREVLERQQRLLQRFLLPTSAPGVDADAVLDAMTHDKKTEAGSIRWVLLEEIGRAAVNRNVPFSLIEETVRELARLR